jgi:Fe-S-cluster containining protein
MAGRWAQTTREVESLLEELGSRAAAFARACGLACRAGCGDCCVNPAVECTPLEMLPAARALLEEGVAEAVRTRLSSPPTPDEEACPFFERRGHAADGRVQGRCGRYAQRPVVCILFGAAARDDGHGGREVLACRVMKHDDPARVERANAVAKGMSASDATLASEAALVLTGICPRRGATRVPLREALRMALEDVLLEDAYTQKEVP